MVKIKRIAPYTNFGGVQCSFFILAIFTNIAVSIILVKIAKPKKPYRTPPKFVQGAILSILTTTIDVNMGRRLLDKVIYKIKLRIKANKDIATIAAIVKVAKKTIYKMRLNFNI